MDLSLLRKIGLSDGEIRIYTALLESGSSPVSRIHEMTGIERRNIYDILNKLIERGLVTYINENKRKYFSTSHPGKIIGYIEEKKGGLDRVRDEVEALLPSMNKIYDVKKASISAEVFRGPEGIKAVWEDMLNYRETYWLGAGRYVPKNLPHFFEGLNRRRIKKKVKWINLLRHELRSEIKRPFPFEEMRFLPPEFSGNPCVIAVFGNKTANLLHGKDMFAFVIESRELAENYKRYHRYLWENVAKPLGKRQQPKAPF